TRELLRGGHAGRTGAHDGDGFTGFARRRLRVHPAFLPALVDDRVLDRLDADRLVVDIEGTGRLTRRRADTTGELREIVGRLQHRQRLLPPVAVNEVVPVRDDVVHRAAVIAERD